MLIFRNIQPQSASGGTVLQMFAGTGVGPTYITTGYGYAGMIVYATNTSYGRFFNTATNFALCGSYNGVNTGGTGANGSAIISGFNANYLSYQVNSFVNTTTGTVNESNNFSGAIISSNTVTAIKIQFSDGSVPASGTASLYGISS